MLTKGSALIRTAQLLKSQKTLQIPARQSHAPWNYRSSTKSNPAWIHYAADGICAFAWWWVLWHIWTEPGHITGEFPFPDVNKWTDKELGIPED